MLPFSFVEQPSFKELIAASQPDLAVPSRYRVVKSLEQKFGSSKDALKHTLAEVEFVATTADCWTAHRRSYSGVTAHWLCQSTFERKSAVLACRRLLGSHTYRLLAEQLHKIHSEYGLKSKVVNTTTDSGSNFVKAFNVFSPSADELDMQTTDISDVLAIGNDLELHPHQKCAAHLLNLVCTSDCDAAEKSLEYKKISRSTFAKCQALWNKTSRSPLASEAVANESPLQLIRPCATRWNSVYDAVKRLNQIIDAKGSQALHNICQRLDLPR